MGLPIARIVAFWVYIGVPLFGKLPCNVGPIQRFRGDAFGLRVNIGIRNTTSFSGSGSRALGVRFMV